MTKKIYYEKVGRRYRPVAEYDSELLSAHPKGNHVVMCYPGGRSTIYDIDPAFAPMIAAGRYAALAIADNIVEASKFKPSKTPVTKEQQVAWKNLEQAFGNDMYAIHLASARDLADAGVAAMQQEAAKLLKNPAVQAAYDHFMLLCKLAKDSEE